MLNNLPRNKIPNSLREKTAFYSSLSSSIVPNRVPGPEKMLNKCIVNEWSRTRKSEWLV